MDRPRSSRRARPSWRARFAGPWRCGNGTRVWRHPTTRSCGWRGARGCRRSGLSWCLRLKGNGIVGLPLEDWLRALDWLLLALWLLLLAFSRRLGRNAEILDAIAVLFEPACELQLLTGGQLQVAGVVGAALVLLVLHAEQR